MIDVLLISPRLPPTDSRYCGDNAYTDILLQHLPPGVRYYHYEDLMATGQARKFKWCQERAKMSANHRGKMFPDRQLK